MLNQGAVEHQILGQALVYLPTHLLLRLLGSKRKCTCVTREGTAVAFHSLIPVFSPPQPVIADVAAGEMQCCKQAVQRLFVERLGEDQPDEAVQEYVVGVLCDGELDVEELRWGSRPEGGRGSRAPQPRPEQE